MTDQELLQQCKDEVADKCGFKTWDLMIDKKAKLLRPIQFYEWQDAKVTEASLLAIQKAREEAAKEFLQIKNIGEDEGRADCTWGDTEYDSLSVAYGFNLCREHAFEIFDRIYKKLTARGR